MDKIANPTAAQPISHKQRIQLWCFALLMLGVPFLGLTISYFNSPEQGRTTFFDIFKPRSSGYCDARFPTNECMVNDFVARWSPESLPKAQLRINTDQQREFACGSQPFPCGATIEQLRAATELNPTAQPGAQPIKATLSACMGERALRAELSAISEAKRRTLIETQAPTGGCAAPTPTELRDAKGQATAIIPNFAGVSATLLDIPECMPEPEREALMASIAKSGTQHVITRSPCSAR